MDKLYERKTNLGLVEFGLLDNFLKELPALGQLEDDVQELGRVYHVLQPDDTGMVHLLQDPHFVHDGRRGLGEGGGGAFTDDFDGNSTGISLTLLFSDKSDLQTSRQSQER